jgi:putative NADPH-quinone reductase
MAKRKRILLIQGHPDAGSGHFGEALAAAYAEGARAAGHEVREVVVAALDFPLLRGRHEWEEGALPPALLPAQQAITWSEHIVLFFPLWLGAMPAVLKGFLEQVARPGFALAREGAPGPRKLLTGRSARVVVTMGMPALMYRWLYRAHSVKALERNILGFVGIAPVHETLIGLVEGDADKRTRWIDRLRTLGGDAA